LSSKYKELFVLGEDYGTLDYKFGPASLSNVPDMFENRGYLPDLGSVLARIHGFVEPSPIVVGPEVSTYLEARGDLAERLIYPMRDGIIEEGDERAWSVVKEVTRFGLLRYAPLSSEDFKGFYCVAALVAGAPRYMYERLFAIHSELNGESEARGRLIKAVTIIPQPLAVAIAQRAVTCTVVESGHGNTQITPISRAVIQHALIPLNRGGNDANMITAEILRDAGYGEYTKERRLIRMFKEAVGLIPTDLNMAVEEAKRNPDRFRVLYRVPNTRIVIDLAENSWQRFLIGEYLFNPGHEIFESYYKRGFMKPSDTHVGRDVILGTMDIADAISKAIEKCSIEVQPLLFQSILLSGGNFAWVVPSGLEGVAVDAAGKIAHMLSLKGISNASVKLVNNPQYSVWQGCIVYGLYVPEDFEWDWTRLEGWYKPTPTTKV
jgi:crenactin